MAMPETESFEIITGTYEEYLLGYLFSPENQTLVQSFASHDHSSSVRCLATSENYLASGASDDRIIIYDLKTRKEHCMLTHHESTVTSVAFTLNHSHVMSASQDGTLAIVRVGNWQLEKLWKNAHKEGSILDIAIHSSGKLALTLGSNSKIFTWNLVKGRVAYVINLSSKSKDPKSLEHLLFAPDDTRFVLYGGKYTEIWSIDLGGVLKIIEHEEKVTCCTWLDNDTLFIGYDDGNIATIEVDTEERKQKQGHSGRVKAVQTFNGYIVTASSSGQIKVWTRKLKELSVVETGCRITCLRIAQWAGKIKKEDIPEDLGEQLVQQKKPIRSSVIVEVDGSSDDGVTEVNEDKKRKKKPKKKKQKVEENTMNTEENEKQSVKDKKFKNKRKATLVNLDETTDTNSIATKKSKKKIKLTK